MDVEDMTKTKPPGLNMIKKSLSSIGLNICSPTLAIPEGKSLSETEIEFRINAIYKNPDHEVGIDCHEEIYADAKSDEIDERGFETREVLSDQIFLVKEEMLTYRGKRYSVSDIAIKWKKDCRMWLWKNKHRKNKSIGEIRDKLQNLNFHN